MGGGAVVCCGEGESGPGSVGEGWEWGGGGHVLMIVMQTT